MQLSVVIVIMSVRGEGGAARGMTRARKISRDGESGEGTRVRIAKAFRRHRLPSIIRIHNVLRSSAQRCLPVENRCKSQFSVDQGDLVLHLVQAF